MLDYRSMTGSLQCGVCNAKFHTTINKLTEPIDVFTEWLDESADAQNRAARKYSSDIARASLDTQDHDQANADDDGFIVEGDDVGFEEE
jgi:transcription elongation factor Elf1